MGSSAAQFTIPDFFANFPWPRQLSEHFLELKAESDAWAESFHPFDQDGIEDLRRAQLSESHLSSPIIFNQVTIQACLVALYFPL